MLSGCQVDGGMDFIDLIEFADWMNGAHGSTRARRVGQGGSMRRMGGAVENATGFSNMPLPQIKNKCSLKQRELQFLGDRARMSHHQVWKDGASGSGGAQLFGGGVCPRWGSSDVGGGGEGAGDAAGVGGEVVVGGVECGLGDRDDGAGWWVSLGAGPGGDHAGGYRVDL
jgi:hypothetical protein